MIESIEISNAYRCGRGQPLLARFSPWLTTLVGGRGSGKSTIVGMIRIGLHREDEIPANLKKEFSDFKRIAGNRTESGMLLPNTSVKIVYHKDGASFLIEWNYGDDTRTISQIGSNGAIISVPGDIRSRFPIRIFSQKQIFTMAENSDALLQTIDDSEYINFTEWKLRWDKEERHYLSLNAQIRESEIALSEKGRILGELDDTNRKLALFEESHHSVTLTKFQQAQRQIQVLDEWRERWVGAESQIRSIAEAMNLFGVDATDFSSHESETDLSGLSLIEIAHTELKGISELLNELAERTSSNRTKWEKSIEESKWASSVADQTSEYKDLIDRLQQEGVDDVGHHELLIKKKQRLQGSLNSLSEIETSVSSLRNQSIDSVAKMKALRKEITQKRIDFLQTILGDNSYIKIEVAPYQPDVLALEASFRAIINRSNDGAFADDILELDRGRPKGGILGRLMQEIPTNPQLAAETLESRLDDLKIHLTAVSREDAASDGMKKPLANHLKKLTPEQIDRIQNWYPADGLKVSYSIDGTRGSFRSIEQASPGQKTAAILAFILSDGTEPLILDQPEDDLDNRLIYDLVVKQIREIKSKRQVIIVTHNPNIVVNGDAEKVLEMSYRSGQCVVAERGTLQSQAIRDAICRVMEGGPEAFEKRYKRIALSKFVA
jgi:energy-coupling factor transporter ATP-binding protein EcfA2